MIRIAVLEDENIFADSLICHIKQFEREHLPEVSFEIHHFANGMAFLEEYRMDYDIIFLDIEMPLLNGMQTAHEIYKIDKTAVLIFVTRLRQYAIHGYEVNAMGYLIKPADYAAIADRMEKALIWLTHRSRKKLALLRENSAVCVDISDVLYVEVNGHNLTYHTFQGNYETRGKLSDCEAELAPFGFSRCNKCYLVNLLHVKEVNATSVSVGETGLQISRGRSKQFMADFISYLKKGGAIC